MSTPKEHLDRYIYHFTHINNIPRILKHGLLANNNPKHIKEECRSVAEAGIQQRRADMDVPCGPGGKVHDYVPLYFGSISPMLLAVVNKKNIDQFEIVYFEFPIKLLEREDVVFTDASANTIVPPNFYSDPSALGNLHWPHIDSRKWGSDSDEIRHRRMAEVLVHSHLPVSEASRVVVWGESGKKYLEKLIAKTDAPFPPIEYENVYERPHFFTRFFCNEPSKSLVAGPRQIAREFNSACEAIAEEKGNAEAPYETPKKLLEALRKDFACLKHTGELVGLKSANGMHKRTVDIHTQEVVKKLKDLPEFQKLPADLQDRVELAAYLHDIGKGPKSRWIKYDGVQQVDPDHPIRAMNMMVDILTNFVLKVKEENAELIVKLVCYHDLVGDVLGRGREEEQIVNVAANELELQCLFALGKADSTSLVEEWWDDKRAKALYERCGLALKDGK